MKCPVCDNVNTSLVCLRCGFDGSTNYEKYPTFGAVGKAPAVSALRREWGQGNPPPPKKKKPWLAIAVCAAIFALGIGIGAGLGGGKAEPTEPVVTTTAPPETTILPETTEPPETTIPPETTEQTEPREIWETNVLMSDKVQPHRDCMLSVDQLDDGSYDCDNYRVLGLGYLRERIKTVTFVDTLSGAPYSAWDVSELKNGAVMAWVKPNGELFDLYIGAEGGVWANESCGELFLGYCNLEQITFGGAFHTENAQEMIDMFYGCYKLKELDLSSFDTSNVETMSDMFMSCWNLEKVDLSSFDTSQVKYMDWMFSNCRALKELDLSSFDTGNVQDMSCMFWGCEVLTGLNLDGFDTSKVQDMSDMFWCCPAGDEWSHLIN